MNKPKKHDSTLEDQLADFTDQILEKNAEQDKDPSTPDPELHALQQTVLRLKNALPDDGPGEAVIRRMRQNIVMQWKQQASKTSEPFWKRFFSPRIPADQKWQPLHIRRLKSLAIYLAAAVALLFVSILLMNKTRFVQPAASGQYLNISIFILFGGLIVLALWFFRRKR